MYRYVVQVQGIPPEFSHRYTSKAKAIRAARAMAAEGHDVSVYDYRHPDMRGAEYARRIWHN